MQGLMIRTILLEEAQMRESSRDVEFNQLDATRLDPIGIIQSIIIVSTEQLEFELGLFLVEVVALFG